MHKLSPSEAPEDLHLFRLDASGSEASDLDCGFSVGVSRFLMLKAGHVSVLWLSFPSLS